MDIKEIFKAIRPLKRRIHLNNAFVCWTYAFVFAGVLSLLLSSAALLFPIPFVKDKLIGIYLSVILSSLLVSIFLGPKALTTIQIADSLGLKERLVTAYQLQNEDGTVVKMQREDTLKALSNADFRALYSLKVPILKICIGAALLLVVFVTSLIPTGAKERAENKEDIINETKKQVEKLDEKRKEVKKSSALSDKKLDEINKEIDELLKDLNSSKNEEDALKALSKARHELDKLKNSTIREDLQKISEKLSANTLSKDLSEALKEGDSDKVGKAIENMKEKLENADKEELKDLAEQLEEAAGEITDNELKGDLTALSETIKSGNMSSAADNLQTLSANLSKSVQNSTESLSALQQGENMSIDQLMEMLNSSKYAISKQAGINLNISQSSGQQGGNQNGTSQQGTQAGSGGLSGNQAGSNQSSQNGQNGQGSQSGQSGQGGQNGQGSQGGQGGQSGQGGQGQGGMSGQMPGGGAGEGSTNNDAGYKAGESSGGVKKTGSKKEEEYAAIYAPNRLGGDSQSSQVNGTKNNSGQSQWNDVKSIPFGESSKVPYSEVYSEYKDEAMSGLSEAQIPSGMKDMVRDYFSTLE